jgi:hypothetical protein
MVWNLIYLAKRAIFKLISELLILILIFYLSVFREISYEISRSYFDNFITVFH